MVAKHVWIKRYSFESMRAQFIEIMTALNEHKIPYFLEGGTLLGIVRDGDLLPWDNDTDISVNAEHLDDFMNVAQIAKDLGWRVKIRYFEEDTPFAAKGAPRAIKITDTWLGKFRGLTRMDVFIKYPMENYMCWTAAERHMRVEKHYYEDCDFIAWNGLQLRAPKNHSDYLTEKYGDWSKTVKNWSCKGEGTIFAAQSNVKGPIVIDQSHKS